MSGQVELVLVVSGMHLLALICAAALLIPALRNPDRPPRRESGGNDGGWGKPRPPAPEPPSQPGGGLPLPDAQPAGIRLRDHEWLGDRLPQRERRPAREPERRPVPSRSG